MLRWGMFLSKLETCKANKLSFGVRLQFDFRFRNVEFLVTEAAEMDEPQPRSRVPKPQWHLMFSWLVLVFKTVVFLLGNEESAKDDLLEDVFRHQKGGWL